MVGTQVALELNAGSVATGPSAGLWLVGLTEAAPVTISQKLQAL
jgi:hypothetical protein